MGAYEEGQANALDEEILNKASKNIEGFELVRGIDDTYRGICGVLRETLFGVILSTEDQSLRRANLGKMRDVTSIGVPYVIGAATWEHMWCLCLISRIR
jgi:hypothetical protein